MKPFLALVLFMYAIPASPATFGVTSMDTRHCR
jgi:hypothetical protein